MKRYKTNNYCTLYLLTNMINGKIYVGQTWSTTEIRMGDDGSRYKNSIKLFNAIKKYGVDNFAYNFLAFAHSQEVADELENQFIELYHSRDPKIGYNLKGGGSVGKHSEETKQKISKTLTGKIVSEATKKRLSKALKGLKKPAHTEDYKNKVSDAMKEWHSNNKHPFIGRHHTEEAKKAMSKKLTGRKIPAEIVRKRADKLFIPREDELKIISIYESGMTLRKMQDDLGYKISTIYRVLKRNNITKRGNTGTWSGKTHSEETKKKMSESRKKIWLDIKKSKNK